MSEDDIQKWKEKYIAKGIPETLLNEMIDEANLEWGIDIGFRDVRLYYALTINLIDEDELQPDEFYVYTVSLANDVIRGYITPMKTHVFADTPAESLHIQVFRITKKYTQENIPYWTVTKYGYALITLSLDTTVDITMNEVGEIVIIKRITGLPFDVELQVLPSTSTEISLTSKDFSQFITDIVLTVEKSLSSKDFYIQMPNISYEVEVT